MKKSFVILATLFMIAYTTPLMAKEATLPPNANKECIEDNLLAGMASDNFGLQRSCALMLGTIQSDRAVVPLMTVLHTSADENLRIAAAWALCKIGDARGVYAVKMAVIYDESTKVQATCAGYCENLVELGVFTYTQPEPTGSTTSE